LRTLLSFFVVLSLIFSLRADEWPARRGRNQDGCTRESLADVPWPNTGPKELWRSQVGTGFSSLVTSRDYVYTMGNADNQDTVYCVNIDTGQTVWKHSYDSPLDDRFFEGGPTSTPTLDGNQLYTFGRSGDLFCFDAATGKVLWSKNIQTETEARIPGWGFSSSPVILEHRLILGVGDAGIALDKSSGEVLWKSGDGEAGYMTPYPVQLNGRWYLIIASGKFYQCVLIESGEVVWKQRWLTTYGCNAADPIARGNQLFISSGYGRGSSLLEMQETGVKVVWAIKDFANQLNSSVLIGDNLYGFDGDEGGEVKLKCVEFATGKVLWAEIGYGSGSLIGVGNRLLVLSEQGELVVVTASGDSHQAIARAKILDGKCWTVPVLSHGRVFARNASGDVVSLQVHTQ
jgi:outer membrane protein assembly factor BamB